MSKRAQKNDSSPSAATSFPIQSGRFVVALAHVVCALLFFTNLTRNPYFTQIALLYILIALAGLLWAVQCFTTDQWILPRVSFEAPLAGFLLVGFVSTFHSWWVHPLLRAGIAFEGVRVWAFTLVNCVVAFYLPFVFVKPLGKNTKPMSIWSDIVLALLWGFLWFGFASMKDPNPRVVIWDTYGAFLWALALLYAYFRTRRGEALEYIHVVFMVALLAGLYGILQYAGKDLIWTSLIQPYGGRPVSTFGNPNFLSSYLMLVSPLALAFALRSKGNDVSGYLFVAAVSTVGVLCTLTRSTYAGLLAAYLTMGVFLFKKEKMKYAQGALAGVAVVVALIVLFPRTPVSAIQSPLARFTELFQAFKSGSVYAPWHQRILIWASAWDMMLERPWFGKGWGCFELFFPFYQGKILLMPGFALLRTHANNAHNILLEMWSQLGFLGTGMALWLMSTILAGGWLIFKRKMEENEKIVAAALLAGMVGMLVDNFLGNVSIFFAVPAFLFWWNAGLLYNEAPGLNKPGLVVERKTLSFAGRALLVVFMFFSTGVSIYYAMRWAQEVYYFDGFKSSKMDLVGDSVKALEKAYAWFPGEVNSNYEMGNSYARQARLFADKKLPDQSRQYTEKAIFAYKAALRANPGYDEIYFNLAITELQVGDKDEAQRNLEIALFINPLLKEAYSSLGNLYINSGQLGKARTVFEQGVLVFPKDRDIWNNYGYVLSQLGDDEKSLVAYRKSVLSDVTFTQGWRNLYVASMKLKKKEPLLEVPPLIKQMESALTQKQYGEAGRAAKRIVELMPENGDARLSYANILFYEQRIDASIDEFKRALALKPSFPVAHVNLGRVYLYKKDVASARLHFNQALEIDPKNADAKAALASLP